MKPTSEVLRPGQSRRAPRSPIPDPLTLDMKKGDRPEAIALS